jgi:hypothetical protein
MIENFKILNGDISLIKIIMILYLIVFTNTITMKFSNKILNNINQNILLKHIVGLITISIILSLLYNLEGKDLIMYSIIIYVVFLLSTKIPTNFVIIFIIILSGLYFFNYFNDKKIIQINNDSSVNDDLKNNIIQNKKNFNKNITLFTLFIVIGGSLLYENKKINQYGGKFTLNQFLN